MRRRGELDGTPELSVWADRIEAATMQTIADGIMTGDLAAVSENENAETVTTDRFIAEIRARYEAMAN